jgi:hypothetical protein
MSPLNHNFGIIKKRYKGLAFCNPHEFDLVKRGIGKIGKFCDFLFIELVCGFINSDGKKFQEASFFYRRDYNVLLCESQGK